VQLVETVPVETRLGNPALPAARDVWIQMIRGARRTLDIEQFYLSTWPGEPLEGVLSAIGEAAGRGVKVRLLLDARMYRTYPMPADSLGRLPHVELRRLDMGRIAGGVQHAKFFIVDGREVFLGSQNFDWRALRHIHELGVRVRDARAARAFGEVFELDWAAAGDSTAARAPVPQRHVPVPIRIAQGRGDTMDLWPSYSPKGFIPDPARWDRDALVRCLDGAQHEVVLQSLDYSLTSRAMTDTTLDAALRRAAARGVKVEMLISDWETDGPEIGDLQRLSTVPGIAARLSTVPEWSGGYIPFARVEHCKYMVVDTLWTWVGTGNWAPDYFSRSRNLAVTMRNRPLALQARRVFEASWTAPGAAPVRADSTYAPKAHGESPPPGVRKYAD
jgi:phosphatidylserine/phosphatidylglycerophosphate/cardiolipin synthase-like enzyme